MDISLIYVAGRFSPTRPAERCRPTTPRRPSDLRRQATVMSKRLLRAGPAARQISPYTGAKRPSPP